MTFEQKSFKSFETDSRIYGGEDFLLKDILEDNTRDSDTERLSESPEEAIYSASEGEVIVRGRGLRGEALRTKEHAETDSSDKGEEDLGGDYKADDDGGGRDGKGAYNRGATRRLGLRLGSRYRRRLRESDKAEDAKDK
ncbi:hypothetical protein G7Y89_g7138 [Cudoniella acicularis]|uniref:Uncharacterized protein n=1 Tax=Cudoniella acicularis TaxID=354080 RepID=A0A8H4RLG4_9HELO|nr:hypothetical protein G7Y89_g7138 [Cudoniella acicularis]